MQMSEESKSSQGNKAKKIDKYLFSLDDKIGEGSFSQVFQGIDQSTNLQVAVKKVRIGEIKSKIARRLLECQVSIVKELHHQNIISCLDVHFSANNCYIVTEFCEEGDLDNQLQKRKRFAQGEILRIIYQVYKGLQYLSQNSIIHRDLKISNILLKQGNVKIADFGFSIKNSNIFKDVSVGSPVYMSPEGLLYNLYGPKSDVWAFGIMIFQLLHGYAPLSGCKTEEELKKKVLEHVNFQVPASVQLIQLVQNCMNVHQKQRLTVKQVGQSTYMRKLRHHFEPQLQQKLYKTASSTSTSPSQITSPFSKGISFDFALSMIHYCRLIHKVMRGKPNLILLRWLKFLSFSLLNAKISGQGISIQKQQNIKQIIQEYHEKYIKQRSEIPMSAVTFEEVIEECYKAQKCSVEEGLKHLFKETELLKKCMENGQLEQFSKKSRSNDYVNNLQH